MDRKRMGRPLKPATAGSRVSLGLKVTAETKEKVAQAADASGRTQSQEAEYRLEQSFDRLDILPDALRLRFGELGGLLFLIGTTMEHAGRRATWDTTQDVDSWQGDKWFSHPDGYAAAEKAAHVALEVFRPTGRAEAAKGYFASIVRDCHQTMNSYLSGGPDAPPYAADVRKIFSSATHKRIAKNAREGARSHE
jgi:hypothetical protein